MKHNENIGLAKWTGNMLKDDPSLCSDGGSLKLIIKYLDYKGHILPPHVISALNTIRTARASFLNKNPNLDKRIEDVKRGGKYHEMQQTFDDFYAEWLEAGTEDSKEPDKNFGLFQEED